MGNVVSLVSVTGLKKKGLQYVAKAGGIKNASDLTVNELKDQIKKLKGTAAKSANSEAQREKTQGN